MDSPRLLCAVFSAVFSPLPTVTCMAYQLRYVSYLERLGESLSDQRATQTHAVLVVVVAAVFVVCFVCMLARSRGLRREVEPVYKATFGGIDGMENTEGLVGRSDFL